MLSPRVQLVKTYGPVPIGLLARSATPVLENIAPTLVVILNNHELDGFLSVTVNSVGEVASALSTTSIAALTAGFHLVLTCSMENTASSAVKSAPLENFTPSRNLNVYVLPSSETVQLSARPGTILPSWSCLTSVS